jgi:site-specific DNA-adenine methylase
MSTYHGGKKRIGNDIATIITEIAVMIEDETGQRFKGYCEPFVGMAGVLQHVASIRSNLRYRAGDINESVIKMWKAAQRGWIPPLKCSRVRFNKLKGNGKSSAEKGFVGHQCGFRGIYFTTFDGRNTVQNTLASNNVSSLATNEFKDVQFSHGPYQQFSRLRGWIIYCDPPYFSNSRYLDESHTARKFDYDHFYTWVLKMSEDNLVFVSERADLCELLPRGSCELVGEFGSDEKLFLLL